jgi:hypothetical protein
MDITLITPPRSGSNFFMQNLVKATGSPGFKKYHNFFESSESSLNISILRDPLECISSIVAHDIEASVKLAAEGYIVMKREIRVPKRINYYIQFIKTLNTKENFITFKYEELIKNPELYISFCADKLELSCDTSNLLSNDSLPIDNFYPSSTKFAHYNDIVEEVKLADLSECYELYNSMDFVIL